MDTQHSAIAASLDVSQVHELAQLSEEAFWDYVRVVCGHCSQAMPIGEVEEKGGQKLAGKASSVHAQSTTQGEAGYAGYLECISSNGRYLLPLASLHEVVSPPRHYAFLPDRPEWMFGLAAWHGEPIAVIDLTRYLTGNTNNAGNTSHTNEHLPPASLLIAHDDDSLLGLLVHSNRSVITASDVLPVLLPLTSPLQTGRQLPAADTTWYLPVRNEVIAGIYSGAIVLDVPALLADIVRQIVVATRHG